MSEEERREEAGLVKKEAEKEREENGEGGI